MKIVVVDDETLLVKGIRFNLQNEGYQVLTGTNGWLVRERARDGSYIAGGAYEKVDAQDGTDLVLTIDMNIQRAAEDALEESEVLIVAGTSLRVYPAAGLIYSSRAKAKILVNAEPTPLDSFFDAFVQGDVANILPEVLK